VFFHVFVCSADAKDVPAKNGKPLLVKTGVHLHWPHIIMSPGQALTLRVKVLDSLGECFGQREEPANDWATALDTSVYPTPSGKKGSGLRMLGSLKKGGEGRPYKLLFVLDSCGH
jgi:hypothetical protein